MIRHTVLFRFKPEVSAEVVSDLLAELDQFPSRYAGMTNWSCGKNISTRDDTMQYGFSVDFDSEEALLAYLHSDSHEHFVHQRWRPIMEKHFIVSYRYEPAADSDQQPPQSDPRPKESP